MDYLQKRYQFFCDRIQDNSMKEPVQQLSYRLQIEVKIPSKFDIEIEQSDRKKDFSKMQLMMERVPNQYKGTFLLQGN